MEKISACSLSELRAMYLFSAFVRKVRDYGGSGEVIAHLDADRIASFEYRVVCRMKD